MTTIRANGIDTIEIVRKDDENRTLALQIECEDGTSIEIGVGMYNDDAYAVRDILAEAAKDFTTKEIEGWEDVPDFDDDGFICDADREPGYYVSLSGHYWTDGVLVPHSSTSPNRAARPFATYDIALYELARAMSSEGYFPNCYRQNDRGITFDIGEEVRKFHDEGGDKPLPLEGVTFEEGAEVVIDGDNATIVKDYGTELGVVYRAQWGERDEHTHDRESITLYVEEEGDE